MAWRKNESNAASQLCKISGYFTFDTEEDQSIEHKIAISYVSIENEKENLRVDNNGRNYQ